MMRRYCRVRDGVKAMIFPGGLFVCLFVHVCVCVFLLMQVHGNLYGTSVASVADVTKRGQVRAFQRCCTSVRFMRFSLLVGRIATATC